MAYQTIGQKEIEMRPSRGADVEVMIGNPEAVPATPATSRNKKMALMAVGVAATVGFFGMVGNSPTTLPEAPMEGHDAERIGFTEFDEDDRVIMDNYDTSRVWASFLPGIGGEWGVPTWGFYVNRGQGMVTFGTQNKDKPIMEWQTANNAYEVVSRVGFRTFVQAEVKGGESWTYEPFSPADSDFEKTGDEPHRTMYVGMNEFEIEEKNKDIGLETNVVYHTVTNEAFGGLVRRTTLKNTGDKAMKISVLDGPARFEPFGVDDWHLTNMGRTLEAWINVENMDETDNTVPFAKLSASLADTAVAEAVVSGNWAVSFIEADGNVDKDGNYNLLPFMVDPDLVFGRDTSFSEPHGLYKASIKEILEGDQVKTAKTPCMLAGLDEYELAAGEAVTITSMYGVGDTFEKYVDTILPVMIKEGFPAKKRTESTELTDRLTEKVATESGVKEFDAYNRQMMLDNLLRGGLPELLGTDKDSNKPFHTFSRIHGDMERDYNYFQIDASFFSQGPGNFRDVAQNRRVDNLQVPQVGDFNMRMFLGFVQSDGYNPLTVNSIFYNLPKPDESDPNSTITELDWLDGAVKPEDQAKVIESLSYPTRPGAIFIALDTAGVELLISDEDFLNLYVDHAEVTFSGQFNQNGYWADHWTYTLDLVETYLDVYPDKKEEAMFDSEPVPFFLSPAVMLDRDHRYVYATATTPPGPRQYNFVRTDPTKTAILAKYAAQPDGSYMRTPSGEVFTVSSFAKLLILAINKFSLIDPEGMGLEMEGGKPGWNDAMNGLCALFGSGMPEMYELIRTLKFTHAVCEQFPARDVVLPAEIDTLLMKSVDLVDQYNADGLTDFQFWDQLAQARDDYRNSTSIYFSGDTVSWATGSLKHMLAKMIDKLESGAAKAVELNGGIAPTYWIYDVTDYELLDTKDDNGLQNVKVLGFKPRGLPLFLEGSVRQMKTITADDEDRDAKLKAIYRKIRDSDLYDTKLKQYKISGSLAGMGIEIGRMVAFSPGWLENESIWLHMSYKYYLELLRGGLYKEYFEEIKTGVVAFMDPKTYGRSPLECSSFIASSSHPDPSIHGQGYLARLSGSTAEYLSMLNLMTLGDGGPMGGPFFYEEGKLSLTLKPIIASWLYTETNSFSFTLLGGVAVTYHFPPGVDSWDCKGTNSVATATDGTIYHFGGSTIPSPFAEQVRNFEIASIEMWFEPADGDDDE